MCCCCWPFADAWLEDPIGEAARQPSSKGKKSQARSSHTNSGKTEEHEGSGYDWRYIPADVSKMPRSRNEKSKNHGNPDEKSKESGKTAEHKGGGYDWRYIPADVPKSSRSQKEKSKHHGKPDEKSKNPGKPDEKSKDNGKTAKSRSKSENLVSVAPSSFVLGFQSMVLSSVCCICSLDLLIQRDGRLSYMVRTHPRWKFHSSANHFELDTRITIKSASQTTKHGRFGTMSTGQMSPLHPSPPHQKSLQPLAPPSTLKTVCAHLPTNILTKRRRSPNSSPPSRYPSRRNVSHQKHQRRRSRHNSHSKSTT